jgi:hypothetical protein
LTHPRSDLPKPGADSSWFQAGRDPVGRIVPASGWMAAAKGREPRGKTIAFHAAKIDEIFKAAVIGASMPDNAARLATSLYDYLARHDGLAIVALARMDWPDDLQILHAIGTQSARLALTSGRRIAHEAQSVFQRLEHERLEIALIARIGVIRKNRSGIGVELHRLSERSFQRLELESIQRLDEALADELLQRSPGAVATTPLGALLCIAGPSGKGEPLTEGIVAAVRAHSSATLVEWKFDAASTQSVIGVDLLEFFERRDQWSTLKALANCVDLNQSISQEAALKVLSRILREPDPDLVSIDALHFVGALLAARVVPDGPDERGKLVDLLGLGDKEIGNSFRRLSAVSDYRGFARPNSDDPGGQVASGLARYLIPLVVGDLQVSASHPNLAVMIAHADEKACVQAVLDAGGDPFTCDTGAESLHEMVRNLGAPNVLGFLDSLFAKRKLESVRARVAAARACIGVPSQPASETAAPR